MINDQSDKPLCHETLKSIHAYVDRELPSELSAHVKEHLQDCPPCEDAFVFEADFKAFIAKRCKDEMPPDLYVRVKEVLRIETTTLKDH